MIEDSNKISKIKKDYMSGKTYKQIAEKHGVTYNEVLYLVKKKQWKNLRVENKFHTQIFLYLNITGQRITKEVLEQKKEIQEH